MRDTNDRRKLLPAIVLPALIGTPFLTPIARVGCCVGDAERFEYGFGGHRWRQPAIRPAFSGELACLGDPRDRVAVIGADTQRLSLRRLPARFLDCCAGRDYRSRGIGRDLRMAGPGAFRYAKGSVRRSCSQARSSAPSRSWASPAISRRWDLTDWRCRSAWSPGVALLALLVAPRFVLYPAQSISGFFAVRYGGSTTRRLAFVIASVATALLLAADIRAGSVALQSLIDITLPQAILTLASSIAVVWLAATLLPRKKILGFGFHCRLRWPARNFDCHSTLHKWLAGAAFHARLRASEPCQSQSDIDHQSSSPT